MRQLILFEKKDGCQIASNLKKMDANASTNLLIDQLFGQFDRTFYK
jgi:hypothetical protein